MLLIVVSAVSLFACGGDNDGDPAQILTVVRVEERDANGTWVPVPGATVTFEIFLESGPTLVSAGNVIQFVAYEAVADSNGISAVVQPAEGKRAKDIGMVFAQVDLPDGRSQFRRVRSQEDFDFKSWYQKFGGDETADATIARQLCESARDFPNCEKSLKDSGLKAWGAGLLLRIR